MIKSNSTKKWMLIRLRICAKSLKKFILYPLILAFIPLGFPGILRAQSQLAQASKDSISPEVAVELDYLQFKLQLSAVKDSSLLKEIDLFNKLVENALKQGDTSLAQFYLASVKDLLKNSLKSSVPIPPVQPDKNLNRRKYGGNSLNNEFYALSGMDISRQDFELVYGGKDSSLLDATNNPYFAIGSDGDVALKKMSDLRWNGILKYSRDYFIGNWHGALQKRFAQSRTAKIWVDMEGMSYQKDIRLKYAQLFSGIQWRGQLGPFVNAFAEYEFLRRVYDHQDENFPNYKRHLFWGSLKFYPALLNSIQLSAQTENRAHDAFQQLDYRNTTYSLSTQYSNLKGTRLSLQVDRRLLTYTNSQIDTTLYQGSYRDWFTTFRAGQRLLNWLGLNLYGEFTSRNYLKNSDYLRNFNYVNVTPSIEFSVNASLSFEIGYLNIRKTYDFKQENLQLAAVKNYSVKGVTFSIDFLNMNNLMISTSISYELRRYRDTGEEISSGFNLYTDQNETTAMAFVSWQFLKNWELNAILHRDAAIDQELEHNDSRLSLFTLELKKKF